MPVPVGTNINMEIRSALSYSFSFFHLLIERFNGLSRIENHLLLQDENRIHIFVKNGPALK